MRDDHERQNSLTDALGQPVLDMRHQDERLGQPLRSQTVSQRQAARAAAVRGLAISLGMGLFLGLILLVLVTSGLEQLERTPLSKTLFALVLVIVLPFMAARWARWVRHQMRSGRGIARLTLLVAGVVGVLVNTGWVTPEDIGIAWTTARTQTMNVIVAALLVTAGAELSLEVFHRFVQSTSLAPLRFIIVVFQLLLLVLLAYFVLSQGVFGG